MGAFPHIYDIHMAEHIEPALLLDREESLIAALEFLAMGLGDLAD